MLPSESGSTTISPLAPRVLGSISPIRSNAPRRLRRRPRILVAEDDAAARARISGIFRSVGHDVREAADGRELVALIEAAVWEGGRHRVPLSMIVSDASMPGFSGLDVLWILRAGFWNVPFVLMAEPGDEALQQEALDLGATAVLEKPIERAELRRVVAATLGASSANAHAWRV